MQYALMNGRGEDQLIVDAEELASLYRLRDSGVAVADVEPDEAGFTFKLIYGSYQPQPGTSPDQAKLDARRHLGARFGTIRDGACFALELCGVELGEPIHIGHSLRIPVAALMASKVKMRSDGSATTVFIRYMNISPLDNVLNRPGIFALRRQEDRCPDDLGRDNWRPFIDHALMIDCASVSECDRHCACCASD